MLPSAAGSGGEQVVHGPPGLFAPDLQGADELGNGGGAAPGPEQMLGGFEVAAVVRDGGTELVSRRWLLAAYQGYKLVTVASGATQTDTFYGAELAHALRFAACYLFEVRVVQDYVGGNLLAPRLVSTPGPQTLEELHSTAT